MGFQSYFKALVLFCIIEYEGLEVFRLDFCKDFLKGNFSISDKVRHGREY